MMRKLRKLPVALVILIGFGVALRFLLLDRFPPGLYSDEASQGYNAYSLLQTGRDEHGTFLPVSIRSFGDWKPPLPTYLIIPFVAMFGLSELSVRLPSAIFGVASVLLSYFFTLELFDFFGNGKREGMLYPQRRDIAFLVAFFINLSPGHILQSRSAMLVMIAFFFVLFALWSFFRGLKNARYWYFSGASFILAIYAYYGMRLSVPLLAILLCLLFRTELFRHKKTVCLVLGLVILMLMPLGLAYLSEPEVVWGRARTVSIFYDRGVELTVWDQVAQDGTEISSPLVQFFHNRPYLYLTDIARRFFQHFDGRYLFIEGDLQPPFQIPGMGVLYLIDGILITAGIYILFKSDRQLLHFISGLTAILVLPAALTFVTPSANRTFSVILPFAIFASVGLSGIINRIKHISIRLAVGGGIILLYLLSFSYFIYQYLVILPKFHADYWHFGYKALVNLLNKIEDNYEIMTLYTKPSVAYIFYLFYDQTDPHELPNLIRRNYHLDAYGFEMVDQVGKLHLLRDFNFRRDSDRLPENSLLVLSGEEKPVGRARIYDQIRYPDGQTAFTLYEIVKDD